MASQFKYREIPYHLIIIFFLLSIVIGIAGYLYYEQQKEYVSASLVTILVSVLIVSVGASVGLFWHKQRAQFYRMQYEAELERLALTQHYEYLTRYANDIILLMDKEWKIIEANERAVTSYGYEREELLQLNLRDLRSPETRAILDAQMKQVEEHNGLIFETVHQRKDETTFPVEISSRVIEVEDKKFYQSIIRDITKRKRAEESLLRVNRALKVLSECNQVLVRATEESDLLHDICKIIVEIGGYHLAWVGFAEQDEKKTVRPVAHEGFEEGYLDTLSITWEDTERGCGPTGTAIRTGNPYIARNILTDPYFTPWRTEAARRGYASSIALPLIVNGRTLGALNIYATEPDAFNDEEVKLLTGLSDDLAYGIMALHTRTEHKGVEEALRTSEEELKKRVKELEEFYDIAVGRELKMIELKEEIESLKEELKRYKKP